MRRVSKLLKESIGRDEVLRAARANAALRSWPKVVGGLLSERSSPDRYDHGTVWIAVSGPAWAQELRMIKSLILQRLNALAAEESLFVDLRFGVRPITPTSAEALVEVETYCVDEELSIREIAERRLANWRDEDSTRA